MQFCIRIRAQYSTLVSFVFNSRNYASTKKGLRRFWLLGEKLRNISAKTFTILSIIDGRIELKVLCYS